MEFDHSHLQETIDAAKAKVDSWRYTPHKAVDDVYEILTNYNVDFPDSASFYDAVTNVLDRLYDAGRHIDGLLSHEYQKSKDREYRETHKDCDHD